MPHTSVNAEDISSTITRLHAVSGILEEALDNIGITTRDVVTSVDVPRWISMYAVKCFSEVVEFDGIQFTR